MKVAVIGTGIAGNVAANRLAREHEVTVFEAADRIGGHTNTERVTVAGREYAVDTGFIVYNDVTYPNFVALLGELGVGSQPTEMSFSVRDEETGFEYNGASLNALFAQRRNLLRPSFYRMLREILRFNREAPALLEPDAPIPTLGEFLARGRYGREFIDHYIVPMGAAIWSAVPGGVLEMPARFFVRFFANHGMLSVNDRPQWRVIRGGSRHYVDALVAGHRDRIRLNAPVVSIRRLPSGVAIKVAGQPAERFDRAFVACHANQALAMLADPTPVEREVLGAFAYQPNEVVLHTDFRLMPRARRAWAAWNYHLRPGRQTGVAVTYNMNILQRLAAPVQFCVTLNHTQAIAPERIIRTYRYDHPVFTAGAVAAQRRHAEIDGARHTYYCGAYWRYGFHEDGVVSALAALEHFKRRGADAQRDFRRTA